MRLSSTARRILVSLEGGTAPLVQRKTNHGIIPMMIVKTRKVKLRILSIDFTNGMVINAEIEEPVVEQTSMFPEKEEESAKTSPPPLSDGQIQSLVKHGHYSIEEVLNMPRGVALVRLGNVIGEYKAYQEGHLFTPTQKFPEGVPPDYQDPWLSGEDPVSFGERISAKPLFNFTKYEEVKRKRGRPRKSPVDML